MLIKTKNEIITKLKGISAILEHMSDTTDNVKWSPEAIILLNEELKVCINSINNYIE